MLPRPMLWFVGALIVFDLLAAFLSVCPSFSGHCIAAALKDTLSYRAAGLIEGNDKLVMAAGTIAIAAFTYTCGGRRRGSGGPVSNRSLWRNQLPKPRGKLWITLAPLSGPT